MRDEFSYVLVKTSEELECLRGVTTSIPYRGLDIASQGTVLRFYDREYIGVGRVDDPQTLVITVDTFLLILKEAKVDKEEVEVKEISEEAGWSKSHYDHNYHFTAEEKEQGFVRLDVYKVAKVWKIGSKDDSGCLWHTFKIFPRYGDKNTKEREIKAMYAQVKALAVIEGVTLE